MSKDQSVQEPIREERIPSIRLTPSNEIVLANLGPLKELAGSWHGCGFNLIARPDKEGNAPLYLELNLTDEHLKFDPISTSIPNRGFAQDDIELFGLTYLEKISDQLTGSALHIEPGIWVSIPHTTAPEESPSVARMASIPHGNSLLAEGSARTVRTPDPHKIISLSAFPSFNTTPFAANPQLIQARTSLSAFPAYTYLQATPPHNFVPATAAAPRSPFPDTVPLLPFSIDGISIQEVIQDPDSLLQAHINEQVKEGWEFEEVTVLNIATRAKVGFQTVAAIPPPLAGPPAGSPTVTVDVNDGGGGIGNIPFLKKNADTALVYATFWIEKVKHPHRLHHPPVLQLQYAQMVLLNFPILGAPPPPGNVGPNLSWPHVSVATLKKVFG